MGWDLVPSLTDVQLEKAVLGCLLVVPECVKEVVECIEPEDFTDAVHRSIFERIRRQRAVTEGEKSRAICCSEITTFPNSLPARRLRPNGFPGAAKTLN